RGAGKPRLELVTQSGELLHVGFMLERRAKTRPVVAKLALSDGEVLTGLCSLGLVAFGQPLGGVENGPWALVLAGERGMPRGRAFEEHLRGAVRMHHQPELQPMIDAKGHAVGF